MSNIQQKPDLQQIHDLNKKLTPRELTIVADARAGMSIKATAAKYGISIQRVKNCRNSILRKTGLANITEVVAEYVQGRIIA